MKQRVSTNLIAVFVALILFSFAGQMVMAQEEKADEMENSLYERLGGTYAIAAVVDALIEKLLVNEILNANPMIDHAHKSLPKAGLKFHVTALVCTLTGGPEKYSGRDMVSSHAHLKINEEQWQAFIVDFVANLNDFKVPEKEQGELVVLVESAKADIVTAE